MTEDIPILPLLVGGLLAVGLGYEIEKRRNKLRLVFNVFDRQESKIAGALEALVESGQLKPFVPVRAG